MNEHPDERQLNDLADDTLSAADRLGVEAHVSSCAPCRDTVESLRVLRAGLRALPRDVAPPTHVLAAVHARIESVDPPAWYARPRLLAAAAVALMVVSSAATALVLRGGADASAPQAAAVEAARPAGTTRPVAAGGLERSYEDAIAELQRTFALQRADLAPETLQVVETSLVVIDGALAEARAALEADPANAGLADLVRAGYERKLDLLRSATSHTRARS
jgi:anti-sigma factor RsiW